MSGCNYSMRCASADRGFTLVLWTVSAVFTCISIDASGEPV